VISAQYVKRMGSLIEAANLLGSFFYGGMLGVFVLAFFFRRVRGARSVLGRSVGGSSDLCLLIFHEYCLSLVQRHRLYRGVATGLIVTAFGRPEYRENREPVFIQPSQLMNNQQAWSPHDVRDISSEPKWRGKSKPTLGLLLVDR
jgi:hypothetical protein